METEDFVLLPEVDHIRMGTGDRLYIADPDASTIRVFSKQGKYLFSIGRKGEGPGEFKRWFGEFTVGKKGRIIQVDYWGGNRWLNIFDADGVFLRIVSLTDLGGRFGPGRIFEVDTGRFLVGIGENWASKKSGSLFFGGHDSSFFSLENKGKEVTKLFSKRLVVEISEYQDKEGRPIPGQVVLLSAFSRARGLLAYQLAESEKVTVLNLESGSSPHGVMKRDSTGK